MTGFPMIVADVYMDPDRDKPRWVAIEMDQRDTRRALMPIVYGGAGISSMEQDQFGWLRGSAWSCLTRTGEYREPFVQFDLDCIGVDLAPYADLEPTVDPTKRATGLSLPPWPSG